jgi:FKBP-type peptidyl-prolyl cis-trans isomerase FkpA
VSEAAPPGRSRLTLILGALLALSLAAHAVRLPRSQPPEPPAPSAPPLPTDPVAAPAAPQSVTTRTIEPALRPFAALGTFVAESNRIPDLQWTEPQLAAFVEGLHASRDGRPYPFDEDAERLRDDINRQVQAMLGGAGADPVEEYFAMLRETENVQKTSSNLHYRITVGGAGTSPRPPDTVVVSYAARLPSGEALPNLTRVRVRVKVEDLLSGLSEGLQLLHPGAKALLYLPPALSFGEGRWPEGVPPGAPIGFFVELHEVIADDW